MRVDDTKPAESAGDFGGGGFATRGRLCADASHSTASVADAEQPLAAEYGPLMVELLF